MGEVVSINSVHPEALVRGLESLLEKARAGSVVGAAIAYVDEDNSASYLILGRRCTAFGLIGALHIMSTDLASDVAATVPEEGP